MLGERIASQSEVITAIVLGYSPCCGVPHRTPTAHTPPSPWLRPAASPAVPVAVKVLRSAFNTGLCMPKTSVVTPSWRHAGMPGGLRGVRGVEPVCLEDERVVYVVVHGDRPGFPAWCVGQVDRDGEAEDLLPQQRGGALAGRCVGRRCAHGS